jgi:hypothetical protein
LCAAAQRDEQVVGNLALCQARLRRPRPIGVQVQSRQIEGLVHSQIDDARYAGKPSQQRGREPAIRVQVSADDLDVDGGGQSEVENLRRCRPGRT